MDGSRLRKSHPLEERYITAIFAVDEIMKIYRETLLDKRSELSQEDQAKAMSSLNGLASAHQILTLQRLEVTRTVDAMLQNQKTVGA